MQKRALEATMPPQRRVKRIPSSRGNVGIQPWERRDPAV
jgi:hypothetical protein